MVALLVIPTDASSSPPTGGTRPPLPPPPPRSTTTKEPDNESRIRVPPPPPPSQKHQKPPPPSQKQTPLKADVPLVPPRIIQAVDSPIPVTTKNDNLFDRSNDGKYIEIASKATLRIPPPPPPPAHRGSSSANRTQSAARSPSSSSELSLDDLRRLVRGSSNNEDAPTITSTLVTDDTAGKNTGKFLSAEEVIPETVVKEETDTEAAEKESANAEKKLKSPTLLKEEAATTANIQEQKQASIDTNTPSEEAETLFSHLKSAPQGSTHRVIPQPPPPPPLAYTPLTATAAAATASTAQQAKPSKIWSATYHSDIPNAAAKLTPPINTVPPMRPQPPSNNRNDIQAQQHGRSQHQIVPYDTIPPSTSSASTRQYAATAGVAGARPRPPMAGQNLPPPGYSSRQQQYNPNLRLGSKPPLGRIPQPPPPGRTASVAVAAPGLVSLWSRVEKGLDSLANLEDAVTGRASNLVHTAVPKKWRRPTSTTRSRSSRPPPQPQKRSRYTPKKAAPTSQPLLTPTARWQKQTSSTNATKKAQATTSLSQASVSLHPYCGPYSLLDSTTNPKCGPNQKQKSPVSVKRVDWDGMNARKMMPANGGASSPNDHQSWNYSSRSSQEGAEQSANANQPTRPVTGSNAGGNPLEPDNAPNQQHGSALTSDPIAMQQQQQQYKGAPHLGPGSPVPPQDAWQQQSKTKNPPSGAAAGKASSPFAEQARKANSNPGSIAQAPRRKSYADDEDDKPSLLSRTIGAIPIPSLGKLFRFRRGKVYNNYASLDAWDAADEDSKQSSGGFLGIFHRKDKGGRSPTPRRTAGEVKKTGNAGTLPQPVQSLLERSDKGKTGSLLSPADKKLIGGIGKSRAMLDGFSFAMFIWGIRELNGLESVPFPAGFSEFASITLPNLFICILTSGDTWAPIALIAAFLTVWANSLLFEGHVQRIAANVAKSVQDETSYARLFLRLVASTPIDAGLPAKLFKAARLQVSAQAELSRLRSFVTYAITAIILTTVDFIRPLLMSILTSVIGLVSLPELRTWPIPFSKLMTESRAIFSVVGREVSAVIGGELKGAGHHPMEAAFKASILAALLAVAFLPALEKRRKFAPNDDVEEENTEEVSRRMAEQISDLGASSAGRLALLSKNGGIEGTMERWRLIQEESSNMAVDISISSIFRRLGYYITSWSILVTPVLIFGFLLDIPISGWSSTTVSRWEAMFEVSLLLLTTNGLVWKTTAKLVESSNLRPDVLGFLKSLSQATEELSPQKMAPQPLRSGANPTAGLMVKNFWAAHVVKRAWAVRGANLFCRNGEVLLLLGDDGAGKSRLLTAVAESIVSPPKQALTSQIQRGNVFVGGIDVTQWDRNELKKRVGLFLNDIRTLAKTADLWSGLSLEEILEPGDGVKFTDPTHKSGALEKSCMIQALKITGLYWSLLPRLPSKLSTILTSREEDLRPSPLRPRYFVLAPSEWNKLTMAKLLAQAIYDSENSVGAGDKIDRCLVGSLFLLDDATMLLSEIEESKLIYDLKRTGAATVLSSNKWATGRLADRIAVVKDGTIVETGTHNELLSRGPQQSYYAAKWQAMTSA